MTWARLPGNNKILARWGNELERSGGTCERMMGKFKSVLPVGNNKAKIRASARPTLQPRENTLDSTLGDESCGLVCVDLASGHPLKYDQMEAFSAVVGKHTAVELQLEIEGSRGWRQVGTAQMDEQFGQDFARGTEYLKDHVNVHANDCHLDAKLFAAAHPYGTGSMLSELGSGAPYRYVANRAANIQSWFRRNPLWAFYQLDTNVKRQLFFQHKRQITAGRTEQRDGAGKFKKCFGSVIPSNIVESTASPPQRLSRARGVS